jgi:hypothetical protein
VTSKRSKRRSAVPGSGARHKASKAQNHSDGAWQLPSGKRLAEFALASGFLAPPLMESSQSAREKRAL